jgi:hypothetical protein
MGVIHINERNGEDIVDWLDKAAKSFAEQMPGERNPYKIAAAEIRALKNTLREYLRTYDTPNADQACELYSHSTEV